jgi:hypothetical protein
MLPLTSIALAERMTFEPISEENRKCAASLS